MFHFLRNAFIGFAAVCAVSAGAAQAEEQMADPVTLAEVSAQSGAEFTAPMPPVRPKPLAKRKAQTAKVARVATVAPATARQQVVAFDPRKFWISVGTGF